MLNQPIEEKWKEEFNKKFCSKTSEPKYSVWNAAALAYPEEIKSFIENLLEQERKRLAEEIVALSDNIEGQYPTQYDEWRAFKIFRNTLRDKYIINK